MQMKIPGRFDPRFEMANKDAERRWQDGMDVMTPKRLLQSDG